MSLALHTHGQVDGVQDVGLYKVMVRAEAEASRFNPLDCSKGQKALIHPRLFSDLLNMPSAIPTFTCGC